MRKLGFLMSAMVLAMTLLLMQPAVATMQGPTGTTAGLCTDYSRLNACTSAAEDDRKTAQLNALKEYTKCLLAADTEPKQKLCKDDYDAKLTTISQTYNNAIAECSRSYVRFCPDGFRCIADGPKCEPIPEPTTVLLVIGGFAVAGGYLRRRASR